MTTQTQSSNDQNVSTKPAPWDILTHCERIRVRREIQKICESGGLNRELLALKIAKVLDSDGTRHTNPVEFEAWYFNVRLSPAAWGDTFQSDVVARNNKVACDIVAWLLDEMFLIDHGSEGIVICRDFPFKPAY